MDNQKQFELIEDYLAGKLEGDALRNFEESLKVDKDLQSEVRVQKDLSNVLGNGPDHAFFRNLSDLRKKHTPKGQSSKMRYWIFGILGMLLLIGLFYFVTGDSENQHSPPKIEETEKPEHNTPHTDKETIIETPTTKSPERNPEEESPNTNEPEQPSENQSSVKKKSPEVTAPPIAANFQPNPQIERRISNLLRADYNFTIEKPLDNSVLNSEGNQSVFEISGTLETSKIPEEDFSLLLELYSNNAEDYKKGKPVFESYLDLTPSETFYQFDLKTELQLPEGLYYYLLKDDFSGAVFSGGKISVMNGE